LPRQRNEPTIAVIIIRLSWTIDDQADALRDRLGNATIWDDPRWRDRREAITTPTAMMG
jgi:hypothetical protein